MGLEQRDPGQAPGLKRRPRADGEIALYWVASAVSRNPKASEYPQRTVRLHGDDIEVGHACRRLTKELQLWLSENGAMAPDVFDGTVKGLIGVYRSTPESPYRNLKHNTAVMYDESLDLLERTVGIRALKPLTGLDVRRWFNEFKAPVAPGKPERVRRAYKAMQMFRVAVKFGVVANIPECDRLNKVLANMRFESPPSRIEQITFAQVQAFNAKAIEMGRLSMAIAQTLEFELTLRQVDVIGQWEPVKTDQAGIVDRGQIWSGGVAWSHIDSDGLLRKKTTKRGQIAEHDTTAYPYLTAMLDRVPSEKRIGPIVIDEGSGLPYRYRHFARVWRKIATAAGIPANVWNRDARAGGVTEGSDAGANIEHLRHHATHANIQTTGKYNRSTVEKTRTVARLRVAHRGETK